MQRPAESASSTITRLLRYDVRRIQLFLDSFEPCSAGPRIATLGHTHEYVVVKRFPLPDHYSPDYCDLALLVDDYPAQPPIGIHVTTKYNEAVIAQMRGVLNALRNSAAHGAQSIDGYTWLCYSYADRWRYDVHAPHKGDNLAKFLEAFHSVLCEGAP